MLTKRLSNQWSITSRSDGDLWTSLDLLGLGNMLTANGSNLGAIECGTPTDRGINIYLFGYELLICFYFGIIYYQVVILSNPWISPYRRWILWGFITL